MEARKIGVDEDMFLRVAYCESRLEIDVQSEFVDKEGKREESYGLFQIHLPSHPTVTREMAIDPAFAVPWAAKKFADGEAYLWTCYRQITKAH